MMSVRSAQQVLSTYRFQKWGEEEKEARAWDSTSSRLGRLQLQRLENPQRFRGLVGKGSRWYLDRILANSKCRSFLMKCILLRKGHFGDVGRQR